jgi:hypothetical protein
VSDPRLGAWDIEKIRQSTAFKEPQQGMRKKVLQTQQITALNSYYTLTRSNMWLLEI